MIYSQPKRDKGSIVFNWSIGVNVMKNKINGKEQYEIKMTMKNGTHKTFFATYNINSQIKLQ